MPTINYWWVAATALAICLGPNNDLLDVQVQSQMLKKIETTLLEKYPNYEMAQKVVAHLPSTLGDQPVSPSKWAQKVSDLMYEITEDHHLVVWYDDAKKERGALFKNKNNFGFRRLESLLGNIAYIRLDEFSTQDQAKQVLSKSMAWMQRHHGFILDLRHNRGGSGELVLQLLSYFFEKPTVINSYRFRYQNKVVHYKTAKNKNKLFKEKPLYVLVGPHTASAAEIFANAIQSFDKGELVGSKTMGLGNVADILQLQKGLSFLFTHGYDDPPKPGKPWQGIGLSPDITTHPSQALATAHRLALSGFAQDALSRKWLDSALNAIYKPAWPEVDHQILDRFGRYHIARSEAGMDFILKMKNKPPITLKATSATTFSLLADPSGPQFWFDRENDQLLRVRMNGSTESFARSERNEGGHKP